MRLPERREIEEGLVELEAEQAEYMAEVSRDIDRMAFDILDEEDARLLVRSVT